MSDTHATHPKKTFDFWCAIPFALTSVVLALTFFVYYSYEKSASSRDQEYFQSLIADTQDAIIDRYTLYEKTLRGGLGLFYASASVERHEWKRYVEALEVRETLPGINGIGYIDFVLAENLEAYIQHARADEAPNFINHPKTPYPDKFIIKYIEPVDINQEAVGLDIGFESNRREAAERARDTGIAALTKKITLVQDSEKQAGFLLLIPVYDYKLTPDTIEERRKYFLGWVYGPFIGKNFLGGLEDITRQQLHFEVYDGETTSSEALIYRHDSKNESHHYHGHDTHNHDNTAKTQISLAGRTWTILWHPSPQYQPPASHTLSKFVLIFGCGFGAFLFFALHHLIRSKQVISQEVKRRTAELAQSEEQFRSAIEYSSIGMALVSPEGKWLKTNKALCNIFGYTEQELLERDFQTLTHPEDLDKDLALLQKMLSDEITTYQMEKRYFHKDGHIIWALLSVSLVWNTDKTPKHFISQIQDISQLKEAQAHSEELRLAMQNAVEGIAKMDRAGRCIFINNSYAALLGYKPEELTGVHWKQVVAPQEHPKMEAAYQKMLNDQKVMIETLGLRKNGSQFYQLLTLVPQNENKGQNQGYYCFAKDITARKIAEEQMVKSNHELERSNHELERFAYIASHDLQEPLRKIGGFTERLETHLHGKLDDKSLTYMAFITDGVERMRELIQGLLAYSRLSTEKVYTEQLDASTVVALALDNLSETIEENVAQISYENLPHVYYDKVMLTQLFQNLIGNAIKYRREENPKIIISAKAIGDYWEFVITDNGMGMEEKYLTRIFEMFQRLHRKEDIRGTGIGLSLCQKIVERYGGKIWATSEVGEGSAFYFTIPIKKL